MLVHHELLTAPDATPTKAVVFLHGILGTGANLRSHARRFIQSCPDFLAVLIDLRAHGRSQGLDGPDTVDNAASDVAQTVKQWSVPVHAVVGHSFGGKVALAFARSHPGLKAVMTLDSAPGPRLEARGSEGTLQVVTMLETLGRPWPDRDAFIAEVERRGQARSLAQWLAMNLESRPEGWVFRLSLPRIHALLEDYFQVDLWPVVEQVAHTKVGPRVHLVIGAKSNVYAQEDRVRAHGLEAESGGYVTVDLLDAGHWVHVEDPQGLSEVLLRRLGP
ncbi:MAG: alpha/beta hydrolase [Archangium sp.]|nr:alpha/beta hydrolase [Archangium sp.]